MATITLDKWQKEFLGTTGDKILYCGRQVGKSVICSMDAAEWAVKHSNKTILMIAAVERQAYALFDKTLDYLAVNYPKMISKGLKKPTKTRIRLKNGSIIWCLPTGLKGIGIRFLTVHRLYGEEASRIPSEVWNAVTPMLLTTGGDTIMLTTPAGKGTYASDVWNNKDDAFRSFKRFSVSSEEVIRQRKICSTWTEMQREKALEHLKREKARFTKLFYAQEYEGKEVESLKRFFSDSVIDSCLVLDRASTKPPLGNTSSSVGDSYLGVDIARLGEDETALVSVVKEGDKLKQIGLKITTKTLLTDTIELIKYSDRNIKYRQIYIDDAGVGAGVFDVLLKDEQTKRKVIAINNARRSLDRDDKRRKKLLKEDLYSNLLRLMEKKLIELYKDDDLKASFRSIQYEYDDKGEIKIYGNYSHLVESTVRACWCIQDKHLNIWVRY